MIDTSQITLLGSFVTTGIFLALFAGLFWFIFQGFLLVGGDQIAVLERRWLGRPMPEGRVIALEGEVGVQAKTLGPGLHFFLPFIYRATLVPMVTIGPNELGLVESIDGAPVKPGRIFARGTEGHNYFQDGENFLKNAGEKGPQIQVLPPGVYRVNPHLFQIQNVPVLNIGNNQVGVVVATDGQPIEPGRLLGKSISSHNNFQDAQSFLEQGGQKGPQIDILLPGSYRIHPRLFQVKVHSATLVPTKKVGLVTAKDGEPLPRTEYVAKGILGHRDFQDSRGFLLNGGQRGPQFDFLKPGTYYINPLLFDVVLDDVLTVERGEVAVVVSNIGKDPTADLLSSADQNSRPNEDAGVDQYVVAPGYRGIQKDVLGPGSYYLNKLAFTSHLIPTTNITIDWALDETSNTRNTNFDPLAIVSHDGFEMTVEVKVILRVLPQQAPHMVARIGTIENLINHVIHPLIDSSFRNQASSAEAMKFMQDRHIEQSKVEEHVREVLQRYHVECVSVLICQIKLPERLMQTMTDKVVAVQQMSMFDAQQEAEGRRREMEKIKAEANLQPELVKAEINVQIATQQKQQSIILAEGTSQSTRLEQEGIAAGIEAVGKAEGEKIRAIGQATAEAYHEQAKALGQQPLSMIEVMKQIADGKIKITPDILIQGAQDGGGQNPLMSAFLGSMMLQKHESNAPHQEKALES